MEETAAPRGEEEQAASDQSSGDEHQQPLVDVKVEVHGGVAAGPGGEDGEEQQAGAQADDTLQADGCASGATFDAGFCS